MQIKKCLIKIFGLVFLFLGAGFFAVVSAQGEYNTWYFGNRAGMLFNQGSCYPVALQNSAMYTNESSTGICDANGNLLFYTDGDSIFNRNHQPMKNGIFSPSYRIESAIQGSMALPVPGSNHLYYLFGSQSFEKSDSNGYLRYSVIDMSLDGGNGEVILANQPLLPEPMEAFGVAQHSNGFDYWIACINYKTGVFNCVRTVNGIIDTNKVSQQIYPGPTPLSIDNRFSPDSKIFKANSTLVINAGIFNYDINLYKFDNTTGKLSDSVSIDIQSNNGRTEFSPNSRYLYVGMWDNLTFMINQYDLSVWHTDSIEKSKKTIFRGHRWYDIIVELQLGPDGKIYVFQSRQDSVSVINTPNLPGNFCNFEYKAVSLGGRENTYGGPYYPNFWFKNRETKCRWGDIVLCEGDSVLLGQKYPAGAVVSWNTGDTTPSLKVKKTGVYVAVIKYSDTLIIDSSTVTFKKPFPVYLGSDTAFCGKFAHLLDAGQGAKNYLWNTGDTTITKLVDQPGIYSVAIKDSNSCENGDTIQIDQLNPPIVQLEMDTINCKYVSLSIAQQDSGARYLWSTGDTSKSIQVNQKGIYSIKASNMFCAITTLIPVDSLPGPFVALGNDTALCEGDSLQLNAGNWDKYLWNTGDTAASVKIVQRGTYSVTVWKNTCTANDSIKLDVLQYPWVDLGPDTLYCEDKPLLLNGGNGDKFLWSTGETSPFIQIQKEGTYWVKASLNGCKVTDTVLLYNNCDMWYYIPTAFTPNGDGHNNVFGIVGENVSSLTMQIFDRWGGLIYSGEGPSAVWDGTYKAQPCPDGVFLYLVTVKGRKNGRIVKENVAGTVTLLR